MPSCPGSLSSPVVGSVFCVYWRSTLLQWMPLGSGYIGSQSLSWALELQKEKSTVRASTTSVHSCEDLDQIQ